MQNGGLLERQEVALVVIDVQEGLIRSMDPEVRMTLTRNLQILITIAKDLDIPIFVTEQYPKGLGKTIPEIQIKLGDIIPVEKLSFSCCGVQTFKENLSRTGRRQTILTGMETHVCVLQTAAELIEQGFQVQVAADAVCSRKKLDWEIGLRWIEKKGAMISTTEIIAFQLFKEAGTEEFRRLSKLLR